MPLLGRAKEGTALALVWHIRVGNGQDITEKPFQHKEWLIILGS